MNRKENFLKANRSGVTVILFAILLPVLLLLSMIAINIAHMQLTRTELKIATDAAARAGGRAWSEHNDLATAKEFARQAAEMNTVSGDPLILSTAEADGQMVFGESIRDGGARFAFRPISESELSDGTVLASGFQVNASHDTPLLFRINDIEAFTPSASSIVTQIERDIALVLDSSGSMFSFEGQVTDQGEGEQFLFDTLTALYNDPANGITEDEYLASIADYQEFQAATDMRPRDRFYVDKIIALLTGDLKDYALSINADYHPWLSAPEMSRWDGLEIAYDAFFDVLESTDQDELVSVVTFDSEARIEAALTADTTLLRAIPGGILPDGSTAVGDGMEQGFAALTGPNARLGAVPTVIVMSDGINRRGANPVSVARRIVRDSPNIVIHTVTFGAEANIPEMEQIAEIGSGKHYHASTTDELVAVFEELAGTFRTLITD
ncbi:VWA domain-containing protein [Mariniblastus sp.]|nr:VWA domain-containing protein [Mariniblastus sp.]